MLRVVYTKKFERDLKRCKRRGKNFEKFKVLAKQLCAGQELARKHRDHQLIGNYIGYRECHIEPDWLLIYKLDGESLIFQRLGSHSDLF